MTTAVDFDGVYSATTSESAFGPPDWGFRQCVEYVEVYRPTGPISVVDFGCGDGRHASYLTSRDRWSVTGIDASAVGLRVASDRAGKDFTPVPFEFNARSISDFERDKPSLPEEADLVMSVTFLDHLEDDLRSRMEKLLRSMVAPGGFLYLGLFSNWDPASPNFVCPDFADPASIGSSTIEAVKHFYDFKELLLDLSSEFQIVYAQQSFERAFDPPLHYHGYIHVLGHRRI